MLALILASVPTLKDDPLLSPAEQYEYFVMGGLSLALTLVNIGIPAPISRMNLSRSMPSDDLIHTFVHRLYLRVCLSYLPFQNLRQLSEETYLLELFAPQ